MPGRLTLRDCPTSPRLHRRRGHPHRPHQAQWLVCRRGRIAVHNGPLLGGLALEVTGVGMHRPPLILMAAYVRLRHGHQGRGALRARTAITQEPRSCAELLIVPHNLNGRLARLRLTAEPPERRPQDAVLLRPQARRVRDIALRRDLQHGQMPCKERLAAIEAAISLGTGTPA
jgi:hypothetical protein